MGVLVGGPLVEAARVALHGALQPVQRLVRPQADDLQLVAVILRPRTSHGDRKALWRWNREVAAERRHGT